MATRHLLYGITLFTACIFQAQGQMGGMMSMMTMIPSMVNDIRESQARAQLMRTVKFVVGHTATPSPEMVNFAVIAGASPSTQAEKDAYLEMMKDVGRKTPEVAAKFAKVVNGTAKLDEMALDAHITKRAMQYDSAVSARRIREQKQEEQKRQQEIDMLKMAQQHELSMMGIIGDSMLATANASALPFGDPTFADPLFGGGAPTADPFAYDLFNTHNTFADPMALDHHMFLQTQQTSQAGPPMPSQPSNTAGQAQQVASQAIAYNDVPAANGGSAVSDGTISLLDILRQFEQTLSQNANPPQPAISRNQNNI